MSEEKTEAKIAEEAPIENSSNETSSCKKGAGYCRPHTGLYIAVIALLLAGYSVFISASANNSVMEEHLKAIDSQVSSITTQIEALGNDVKSNRESLIQTKLQRALTSIQEIGGMATEETKSTIAEVEKMLRALTSAGGTPEAPIVVEPETPAIEAAPVAEAPAAHEAAPAVVEPEAAPVEKPAAKAPAAEATAPDVPAAEPEAPTGPQEF